MSSTVWLPLPERTGHPPDPALAAMRSAMADAVGNGAWNTSPPAEVLEIAGVRVLRHACTTPARGNVLHFHGGGFRLGMPEAVAPYARRLADRCSVDVYCPAYRLSPYHPFPAALNDGWAVASALAQLDNGLIVAGDSAGGGLAASIAACLTEARIGSRALILHSPWLDLTVTSKTFEVNARSDALFSRTAAVTAADLYLQQACAPDEPVVSPLFHDPALFPQTLITVGAGEVLLGDATAMHDRLREAGIPVRLVEIADMDHIAVTRGLHLPGAAQVMAATEEFLADIPGL